MGLWVLFTWWFFLLARAIKIITFVVDHKSIFVFFDKKDIGANGSFIK